jgi:kynurenine formamidase
MLYDLSQPLWEYAPKWVAQPEVEFFDLRQIVRDGVCTRGIRTSLHAGTHIDAPSHFPGGNMTTVDKIPLDQLCGTGVVLDVRRDAWGAVTGEDLETASPTIERGDRVVLNFGWHEHWGVDDEMFMLRYPGLDKTAVDWFVERGVSWVGSDTPSPDHAFNLSGLIAPHRPDVFPEDVLAGIDWDRFEKTYCHRTLLANNIPMLEQLGGQIDEVTGQRVTFFALPPKLKNSEAAQIRVVAVTD